MSKVVAIRYAGVMPVYNMEVYKHHNYVTPFGSILHNCRYFCLSRSLSAMNPTKEPKKTYEDLIEDRKETYETFMCGGEPSEGYMAS